VRRNSKLVALGVPIAVVALGAAACGGGSSSAGGSSGPSGHKGGTLRVLGASDVANVDPAGAYDTNSYSLLRLWSRQLYSNPSGNSVAARANVVPDLADGMPTVSADGKTYTVKIKQGVTWNAPSGPRQVTAQDAVRGLKLTCNPVIPFNGPYYQALIAGMGDFCSGFGSVSATDAAAEKAYVEGHDASGLKAVDDSTLQITLTQPAGDFLHMLTLPSSSPQPIEALSYIPDSPEYKQHTIADGPYQLTSYVPNKSYVFKHNPAWASSTDTLRKAYVDEVDVTLGLDEAGIQQQLQAGTGDMALGDEQVPAASLATLERTNDPGLTFNPTGGQNPYLVFNLASGGNKALQNLQVRQALNYAVNKQAVAQALGGTKVAAPTGQIFNQSVVGDGFQKQDIYATPNSAGDAAKAKSILAAAGYPNGLALTLAYRTDDPGPAIAATLQQGLKAAGVNLTLKAVSNHDFYNRFLAKADIAKSGQWDMAEPGWSPDWEGDSERSYFTVLLDGRIAGQPQSSDYGFYNNDAVNAAADKALATTDQAAAAQQWNQIDGMIMKDAPWVPLIAQTQANYHNHRVKNFLYYFSGAQGDYANVYVQ
jgi:peptide/nickel transport system substrate-binding protein